MPEVLPVVFGAEDLDDLTPTRNDAVHRSAPLGRGDVKGTPLAGQTSPGIARSAVKRLGALKTERVMLPRRNSSARRHASLESLLLPRVGSGIVTTSSSARGSSSS